MIRQLLLTALLMLASTAQLVADDNLELIKLSVTPAGPPSPLLRYRFSPANRQLVDGNAAALYYRALVVLEQHDRDHKARRQVSEWLETPVAELPREEVRQTLEQLRAVLAEVRIGTRRKQAVWDLPLREQGIATLLPEIQEMREVARILKLKTRLAILNGDYDAASRDLEDLYTMGRHLGESGTLVSMLVGLTAHGSASDALQTWIAQPDSPNAYWALTSIPSATRNLTTGIESEDMWIYGTIPHAELLEVAILTPTQLEEITREIGSLFNSPWTGVKLKLGLSQGETRDIEVPAPVAALPVVLRAYPVCKRQLLESGMAPDFVEAMQPLQVVMLRWVQVYRELLDEMVVWSRRPYSESRAAMKELDDRFDGLARRPEAVLANLMLPAINAASVAVYRGEQRIAMLRTVEALRLYAAAHHGRLPETLDAITEVPIPLDPLTGAPFDYRLEGETATLKSLAPRLNPDTRFEITISKPVIQLRY